MKIPRLVLVSLLGILLVAGASCSSGIPPSEGHPYWEYSGKQPPYSKSQDGVSVHLINNKGAADPTWQQLEAFLFSDKTDEKDYNSSSFYCTAFAEEVHNNAEKAGIRAAWVSVDFTDKSKGHALNAFNTTDNGLVYVDCTGGTFSSPFSTPDEYEGEYNLSAIVIKHDTVAYVSIGQEYGLINVSVADSYGFSYQDYERFISDWGNFSEELDKLTSEVENYSAFYNSCGGFPSSGECSRILSWLTDLREKGDILNDQFYALGCFKLESPGIVSDIEIWW